MRTEQDLRDAFTLLDRAAGLRVEALNAGLEPVLLRGAPARRPATRRRWVAPASIAASVALVAGTAAAVVALASDGGSPRQHGVAAASGSGGRSVPPSPSASPSLSTTPSTSTPSPSGPLTAMPWRELAFTVDAPDLATAGTLLDRDEQILDLVGPSGSYVVRVFTTAAGAAYDPAGAQKVSVGGRPGYYGQLTSDPDGQQTGLAWQYAPGAWASVARIDGTITVSRAVELAGSVHVGAASVARTPVAFAPLAGLRTSLWLTGYGNDPKRAGQHGYWKWNALYDLELGRAQLTVSADDIPGSGVTTGDATTIHGHPAHVVFDPSGHLVSIDWNGHAVNVQENVDGTTGKFWLTRAQLLAVARSVTLVDHPADTTTWYDAASALRP